MSPARQCVSLLKGSHRFIFCYSRGQEPAVLGSLISMAARNEYDFDWFDAAVVSYHLGRQYGVSQKLAEIGGTSSDGAGMECRNPPEGFRSLDAGRQNG